VPSSIHNENYIKPAVSFKRENMVEELNQSERLSSYTPSERTKSKEYFLNFTSVFPKRFNERKFK
jgi:hypothetical protein